MQIERGQYEEAYRVGLKHHDGQFGITEAKALLKPTGLNPASAADLVYGLSHLLKGTLYIRSLSLAVTNDYLTWIRRDRGDRALANALVSLRQHIEYNTGKLNAPSPGLRALLTKHEALLKRGGESVLLLEWLDQESSGYTEELPLAWFAKEGLLTEVNYTVRDSRGRLHTAWCNVNVDGAVADLDYRPYQEQNDREGMLLGVARLHFADEDRSAISKIEWQPIGVHHFTGSHFKEAGFMVPPEQDYQPPPQPAGKSARQVRERPGQAAFRRKLKAVYDNHCCISGCTVSEALEGAHIDPYIAPASDNIRNGLLLRSDLHKLFDRHLIAVHPETLKVHVSKRARGNAGYEPLREVALRVPFEPTHRPDPGALRRHWQNKHD